MAKGYKYLIRKYAIFAVPLLIVLATALLVSADSLGFASDSTAVDHGAGCDKP